MSVAPGSVWSIPNHRRPRGLRRGSTGPSGDFVYALAEAAIPVERLVIRADPECPQLHAFVEPVASIELSAYEDDLWEYQSELEEGMALSDTVYLYLTLERVMMDLDGNSFANCATAIALA